MKTMAYQYLTKLGLSAQAAQSLCSAGAFASPVALGTVGGAAAIQATDFRYPLASYALISLAIQLLIALLRSWFGERKELLATMKEQTAAVAESYRGIISQMELQRREDKLSRHAMANALSALSVERALLRAGVPKDEVPSTDLQAIYFDVLRQGEVSGEIHMTSPHVTYPGGSGD